MTFSVPEGHMATMCLGAYHGETLDNQQPISEFSLCQVAALHHLAKAALLPAVLSSHLIFLAAVSLHPFVISYNMDEKSIYNCIK